MAMGERASILVIACGALAHEIVALRRINGWPHLEVTVPAGRAAQPPREDPGSRARQDPQPTAGKFASIFVAYADCGTGGLLDKVLARKASSAFPARTATSFLPAAQAFAALADAEPGTFYLTDFLLAFRAADHAGPGAGPASRVAAAVFRQLHAPGLSGAAGIARHAEAGRAAERLGLEFEHRVTGYGELQHSLQRAGEGVVFWQN
jgi:hypothetical protein